MQDLSNLVNRYKPIAEHKQDVVIDEFAKSIIDRVFNNLAIIFPAWKYNWKSDDPTDPDKLLRSAKREWTKAFVENEICTMEQISNGFKKARQSNTDFLPSCGKFISWCKPSASDLGYPNTNEALRLCVQYRNASKMGLKPQYSHFIHELTNKIDWFLLNAVSNQVEQKKADIYFDELYIAYVNDYRAPIESDLNKLETENIVRERMTPEQLEDGRKRGLSVLRDIKNKLKQRG